MSNSSNAVSVPCIVLNSSHLLLILAESFHAKVKEQGEETQGSSREGSRGFGSGKGRRTGSENKTEDFI